MATSDHHSRKNAWTRLWANLAVSRNAPRGARRARPVPVVVPWTPADPPPPIHLELHTMGGRKRLIVIANTPEKRQAIEGFLRPSEEKWSVLPTSRTGESLVDLARQQHADALVFHVERGDTGLMESLEIVARELPELARFVLCDPEDQAQVRALPGTPPVLLAQAADAQELEARLTRRFVMDQWLGRREIREMLPRIRALPTLPMTYQRVFEALLETGCTGPELAALISQDPGLTAQLLKVVNSIAAAPTPPVESVEDAVGALGVGRLRALVMSPQAYCFVDEDLCPGFSPRAEWEHALTVARIARKIALKSDHNPRLAEAAFTAAILHDVGKLLLAVNFPDRYAEVLQERARDPRPQWALEREHLGLHHGELGGCLLGVWGLPLTVIEAVAWHHDPASAPRRNPAVLTLVHIADRRARGLPPDMDHLRAAGLTHLARGGSPVSAPAPPT